MSVVLEGVLEKRADVLRVWRSRWFALTEDGLLSYWLKARSAAGDRGMAKCTRQTRDITSVLSHEGFFAIDWKDGSTWNMRAPADSSKQFQVNWVMQLKQMTVGAAFGRSPRAASASAVVAVGHGDSVDSTFGGSSQSLDDNGRGQATGGARAVPVFRQLPPPPPERRDDVVATKETSASSPSASLSSSSCSSSTLPSSCISSGGTPSTSLATAASHVGPPSLSLSFSTQNDSRDQHCVDSDPVIRGNATTRHCPGCNSSRLRIKPICGACQGDGFFVVRETPDKTDLLTRFKRGDAVVGDCFACQKNPALAVLKWWCSTCKQGWGMDVIGETTLPSEGQSQSLEDSGTATSARRDVFTDEPPPPYKGQGPPPYSQVRARNNDTV